MSCNVQINESLQTPLVFKVEWSKSLTVLVRCLKRFKNHRCVGGRMVEELDCVGFLFEHIQKPLGFGGRIVENFDCIGLLFENI